MNKLILLLIALCPLLSFTTGANKDGFTTVEHAFQINEKEVMIHQITDEYGTPQYYYTDINKYPRDGEKEVKTMNLRMYWDALGHYLTFEVRNGQELTKINGNEFSDKDYVKLHKILNNPHSELKHYKYDDMTSKQCENQYQVDAVSGATSTEYAFEYINGAIKTTYALWHLAHGGISAEIKELNSKFYKQRTLNSDFSIKNYKEANSMQKFIYLNNILANKTALGNEEIAMLTADLSVDNYAVFCAILAKLNSGSDLSYSAVIPYLVASQFKQFESYNLLEKNEQHKVIKKTILDFHHIAF